MKQRSNLTVSWQRFGCRLGRLATTVGFTLTLGAQQLWAQAPPQPFPTYAFSIISFDSRERFHYSTQIPIQRLTQQPDLQERLRQLPQLGDFFAYLNKSVFAATSSRSATQAYTGPSTLELFEEAPRTELVEQPDGTIAVITTPPPVARIPLLDPSKRQLLLLSKLDEPNDEGLLYEAIVLDDSPTTFPSGSFRIINFLDRDVALTFGNLPRQRVKGRDMTIIPPPAEVPGPMQVNLWDPTVNRERAVYTKVWYYLPSVRQIIFIRENKSNPGYLSLFKIRESQEQLARPPE